MRKSRIGLGAWFMLALVVVVLSVAGCSSQSPLVGKWVQTGGAVTLTMSANGNYVMTDSTPGAALSYLSGKWTDKRNGTFEEIPNVNGGTVNIVKDEFVGNGQDSVMLTFPNGSSFVFNRVEDTTNS